MPFEKGRPKTGGKRKGVPHKVPSHKTLEEKFAEKGFDVVDWLIAGLGDMPSFQRVDVLVKLLEFIHPKRRVIEQTLNATVTNNDDRVKELWKGYEQAEKEKLLVTSASSATQVPPQNIN